MVEWDDPCSTSEPIWQHRKDIDNLSPIPCVTVGILLQETDDDIRVTLSLNPDCFSQATTIPKQAILRIRELKARRNE